MCCCIADGGACATMTLQTFRTAIAECDVCQNSTGNGFDVLGGADLWTLPRGEKIVLLERLLPRLAQQLLAGFYSV